MRYDGPVDIYRDLDRVLCVLQGEKYEDCYTIGKVLDWKFRSMGHGVKSPFDNMAESDHFNIRFFMKGTVHLVFKDEKLWELFNVTAAKGRAWLGENTQQPPTEESQTSLWRVL
jgi:Domain of unknown function (DUF4942)